MSQLAELETADVVVDDDDPISVPEPVPSSSVGTASTRVSVAVQASSFANENVCIHCAAGISKTREDVGVEAKPCQRDFGVQCSSESIDLDLREPSDYDPTEPSNVDQPSGRSSGSDDSHDSDYQLFSSPTLSDDITSDDEDRCQSRVNERKFLVFESSLDQLLARCPECGAAVLDRKKSHVGSMVAVSLVCEAGHDVCWESQPKVRRRLPLGEYPSLLFVIGLFLNTGYPR